MKINTALLPLIDLVFLALGALLAGMTQMEIVRALPVELAQVGRGTTPIRQDSFDVLTLVAPGQMMLNGRVVQQDDLGTRLEHQHVVVRAHKKLPTEDVVKALAVLSQASVEVSLEVAEEPFLAHP